jgi:hypothetical protein
MAPEKQGYSGSVIKKKPTQPNKARLARHEFLKLQILCDSTIFLYEMSLFA